MIADFTHYGGHGPVAHYRFPGAGSFCQDNQKIQRTTRNVGLGCPLSYIFSLVFLYSLVNRRVKCQQNSLECSKVHYIFLNISLGGGGFLYAPVARGVNLHVMCNGYRNFFDPPICLPFFHGLRLAPLHGDQRVFFNLKSA